MGAYITITCGQIQADISMPPHIGWQPDMVREAVDTAIAGVKDLMAEAVRLGIVDMEVTETDGE